MDKDTKRGLIGAVTFPIAVIGFIAYVCWALSQSAAGNYFPLVALGVLFLAIFGFGLGILSGANFSLGCAPVPPAAPPFQKENTND